MRLAFRRLLSAVIVFVMTAGLAPAQEFAKTIMTGGPSGTYIKIGRDISTLAAQCGLDYTVKESAGSLENFLGVRKLPNTQFGIVQSDVLEYLRTFSSDDPDIARAIFGVRIAFPLYNEEVHLLATRDIASLSDLAGKRVAIGVENSGTYLTASLVLDLARVEPGERRTINATDSLAALLAGQIDAFFYVAGAPTALFEDEAIDGEKYHLVPLTDETLKAVYVPATIPAGTYPFQDEAVDLIAVKAVMMTFDYDPRRNAYHRESCKAVADMASLVFTNFEELKKVGHPKWNEVDLTAIPPGWDIASCVNTGLAADYQLQCTAPQPAAAESGSTAESEANAAYRKRICEVIGC